MVDIEAGRPHTNAAHDCDGFILLLILAGVP